MPENDVVRIEQLRQATRADHEAVERAMPLLREGLTAEEYRQTLERIYGLICPWELRLEVEIAAALRPFARARGRRELLAMDLRALGSDPAGLAWVTLPAFGSPAAMMGAMYVIEGSRLGGQLLARSVRELLGPVAEGSTHYFSGFGTQTGSMWREFLEVVSEAVPDAETDLAVQGAKQMFACFGDWVSGQPESVSAAETGGLGVVS